MKKLPRGCDQQGRYLEAAEAATDVGQDDPNFYSDEHLRSELIALAVWALVIMAVVAAIGFFVGVYS